MAEYLLFHPAPRPAPPPQPPPQPARENGKDFLDHPENDHLYLTPMLLWVGGIVIGFLLHSLCAGHIHARTLRFLLALFPIQILAPGLALLSLQEKAAANGWKQCLDLPPQPRSPKEWCHLLWKPFLLLLAGVFAINLLMKFLAVHYHWNVPMLQELAQFFRESAVLCKILIAFSVVLLIPVSEEIGFRLLLFRTLRQGIGWWAMLVTPAIFSLLHGAPLFFPGLFLVGYMLQTTRNRFGLTGSILLHGAYNAVSLLLLFF